tara:strand:- start:229 stop:438 length:210 start_codon:yes stop_codon:yes gene_type:complete
MNRELLKQAVIRKLAFAGLANPLNIARKSLGSVTKAFGSKAGGLGAVKAVKPVSSIKPVKSISGATSAV